MKTFFYSLGVGFALLSSTLSYAVNMPAFAVTAITPVTMQLPSNGSAVAQYQVTNQTTKTRTLTVKPVTGITQITTGTNICPSPFTLAPQQSCLLTLQIIGSQIPPTITGGPVVCKTLSAGNNNPDPFLCSQPAAGNQLSVSLIPAIPNQRAYITNWLGNSISLCDVSTFDGSLSNCTVTASGAPFSEPEAVTINANGSLLYVANIGNSTVSLCQVDSQFGTLSGCASTGSGFNGADGISINPAGTQAYASNAGSASVSLCQVNSSTGALSGCTLTGNGFHIPSDMTLNASGTIAYISDLANTVSVCPINSTTGTLSCSNTLGGFDEPEGITLHPNGQFAYITNNGSNNITVCRVNPLNGNLFSCALTEGNFDGFGNLAFNNQGTRAYIPRLASNSITMCLVNQINGSLSLCSTTQVSTLDGPSGIILQ